MAISMRSPFPEIVVDLSPIELDEIRAGPAPGG
jgi:hypothetical protein